VKIVSLFVRPRGARTWLALAALSATAASCFVDATYPDPSSAGSPPIFDPAAVEPLRVNATISPLLVSWYEDPNAASACIRGFADAAQLEKLRAFGVCLESSAKPASALATCVDDKAPRWDACMASSFDWISCSCQAPSATCAAPSGLTEVPTCTVATAKLPPACTALGPGDLTRVLTAVGQAGEAMVAYELSTDGPVLGTGESTVLDRPLSTERKTRFAEAFTNAAAALGCDSTNSAAACDTTTTPVPRTFTAVQPTLAISGGAADGAYPAGYLYELLQARRYAISKNPAAKNNRFSAVVGNSVGALLAPMIDLALTDAPASASSLAWCQNQIKPRPAAPPATASDCGIELLRTYLQTSEEWNVVCVEDASFLNDFVRGPSDPNDLGKPAFGRFWPAERDIVKPFYDQFGELVMKNETTRVVMTADTQSKTMLGLDERVCRTAQPPVPSLPSLPQYSCSSGGEGSTLDCLPCGVLASVPNPLFARASRHVWTGHRPEGESGTFLDGGLRSTFPVLRAVELSALGLDLSRGTPVLALSTARAQSLPSPPPRIGIDLALVSLDSLTHETHHWELAYATLFEETRRKRARVPLSAANGAPICGGVTASPSPTAGAIFADFMPAKIDGLEFAVSGYQFDPKVMTGLFIAGRRAFLDEARDTKRNVLQAMGWDLVWNAVKTPGPGGTSWLDDRLALVVADKAAWQATFPKNMTEWDAHILERRKLLEDKIEYCP
jgi:hypothetical protein